MHIGMYIHVTLTSHNLVTFYDRESQNGHKNKGIKMAAKQQNDARKTTRFDGVYQRTSRTKKYEGKPDVTYIIDYYDPHTGKRIRKAIGNRSEGITAEYANTVRQTLVSTAKKEVLEGIAPQKAKNIPTFEQAWLRYKSDWLDVHASKGTVYNDGKYYEFHIKTRDINNRPLNKITVADLDSMVKDKQAANYAPQTIKTMLSLIRRVMNKAMKWKMWRGPSPFGEFTMPEVDNERTRYLDETQLQNVFTRLKEKNYRAWVMAIIALQCGLRFGDIAQLELSDINFEDGTLFIRKPKNRRSRYVVMPQTVVESLQDWMQSMRSNLVFPSRNNTVLCNVDNDFREVIDELGLNDDVVENKDRLVFHSLRHTYASYLAKRGYTEMQLAKLLGHRSTEMTRRYTHLMPETQREAAQDVETVFKVAHQASPL